MNILFIYSMKDSQNPEKPLTSQTAIQFGISYISSVLKVHNYKTELLVITYKTQKHSIKEIVENFQPHLICFTAVASEYDHIKEIAHYIKSHYPSPYLIAGGPHVTLNPEETINDSFDSICIGEGEYPTLELVQKLKRKEKITGIKNLWIKDNGKIEKNPTREFIQDLDTLPFPDRKMWQKWMQDSKEKHAITLGRGCPFQCTYCCNHAFKTIASGQYVRFRSPDNIIMELNEIIQYFPETKEIYFEVETIGVNMNFAEELCSKLNHFNSKLNNTLTFGVNLRISSNINYDKLFSNFNNSNFRYIKVGLESGSSRVRKEILKRNYSNDDVIKTIQLAKKYNLKISTYVMVGIPGETLSDFKETIECLNQSQPDRASLSIFHPYPGTELYNVCKEMGLLDTDRVSRHERKIATLDLPGFPKKEIQKQYDWFPYNVYKGRKSPFSLLKRVFYRRLSSIYRTFRFSISSHIKKNDKKAENN